MTEFIDIKPGEWVLAFYQPYGPYDRQMPEHLEMFARHGGGWDNHQATEIFLTHQVADVKPKTYFAADGERFPRTHVIAALQSKEAAVILRDKFFTIGVESDELIEREMYRRVQPFADRQRTKALKKVHACLPHIFGRGN